MGDNLLILGGLFLLLHGVLLYAHNWLQQRVVRRVKGHLPASVAELNTLRDRLRTVIERGAFHCHAEFSGQLAAIKPLQALVSQRPCIWYYCKVVQIYQNGNNRREQTVFESELPLEAYLVCPDTGERLHLFLEKVGRGMRNQLCKTTKHSEFQSDYPSMIPSSKHITQRHIIGYEITELVLTEGMPLYVCGEVVETDAEEFILRAPRGWLDMVALDSSKRAYLDNSHKSHTVGVILAPILLVLGVGLCLFGGW